MWQGIRVVCLKFLIDTKKLEVNYNPDSEQKLLL